MVLQMTAPLLPERAEIRRQRATSRLPLQTICSALPKAVPAILSSPAAGKRRAQAQSAPVRSQLQYAKVVCRLPSERDSIERKAAGCQLTTTSTEPGNAPATARAGHP